MVEGRRRSRVGVCMRQPPIPFPVVGNSRHKWGKCRFAQRVTRLCCPWVASTRPMPANPNAAPTRPHAPMHLIACQQVLQLLHALLQRLVEGLLLVQLLHQLRVLVRELALFCDHLRHVLLHLPTRRGR